MAKRIAVKYIGNMYSRSTSMRFIPEGTEFKGVISFKIAGNLGVFIRGSNLTKASKGKHKFKGKQYLFILGENRKLNSMEVVTTKELS